MCCTDFCGCEKEQDNEDDTEFGSDYDTDSSVKTDEIYE